MTVDDLNADAHRTVPGQRFAPGQDRCAARTAREAVPSTLCDVARTAAAKLFEQGVKARVRDGQALRVHHRLGEARSQQRVAEVVHVDEAMHVRRGVDAAPELPQLS